jgi:F420-0:gamma-glutamyl ligase
MGGVGALSRGHSMAELATRRAAAFIAVPGVPLISPGDDLGTILVDNLESVGLQLHNDDVLVIAQMVVSKIGGPLCRSCCRGAVAARTGVGNSRR